MMSAFHPTSDPAVYKGRYLSLEYRRKFGMKLDSSC